MEAPIHNISALFAQLGLPADEAAINAFIVTHSPLAPELAVEDAPFWTPAQRGLLQTGICADADWAGVIDELSVRLRG